MDFEERNAYVHHVFPPPTCRTRLTAVLAACGALLIAVPAVGQAPRLVTAASANPQPLPGIIRFDNDTTITAKNSTVEVSRAKVQFSLPTLYVRGLYNFCAASAADNQASPGSGDRDRCTKMFRLPLPAQYKDPEHQLVGGTFDGYVVSSPGPNPSYGAIPPTTARALVFGSVPVTATVSLKQTSSNGYLDPLRAQYFLVLQENQGASDAGVGTPSYPGFGPVPPPTAPGVPRVIVARADIVSTFDVRLSDVEVDGHAVNLGARCTTKQPAKLRFTLPLGPAGDYVDSQGNVQIAPRGTPGAFDPIKDTKNGTLPGPGIFDAVVNIPSFHNCGVGQNLDPLLTALVSSPANHVSGLVPYGLPDPLSGWCNIPIAHCTSSQVEAQKRVQALNAAMARHASPAVIKKLQAKIKPSDYEVPKVKVPKNYGK